MFHAWPEETELLQDSNTSLHGSISAAQGWCMAPGFRTRPPSRPTGRPGHSWGIKALPFRLPAALRVSRKCLTLVAAPLRSQGTYGLAARRQVAAGGSSRLGTCSVPVPPTGELLLITVRGFPLLPHPRPLSRRQKAEDQKSEVQAMPC